MKDLLCPGYFRTQLQKSTGELCDRRAAGGLVWGADPLPKGSKIDIFQGMTHVTLISDLGHVCTPS
jgi:hypothetical protein